MQILSNKLTNKYKFTIFVTICWGVLSIYTRVKVMLVVDLYKSSVSGKTS